MEQGKQQVLGALSAGDELFDSHKNGGRIILKRAVSVFLINLWKSSGI